jgi:hypothetical protein
MGGEFSWGSGGSCGGSEILETLSNSVRSSLREGPDALQSPFPTLASHRSGGARDAEAAGDIDASVAAGKSDMENDASVAIR